MEKEELQEKIVHPEIVAEVEKKIREKWKEIYFLIGLLLCHIAI